MAGLYFHVPYCHKACHYCDFHFSTGIRDAEQMVAAMLHEIELRRDYFQGQKVDTIYFGGGTPSILQDQWIDALLNKAQSVFHLSDQVEITLEANPEDLTQEKLQSLKSMGFNRLSIGIQSFRDQDLIYMNRNHSAVQSMAVVELARKYNFQNLTIDLIYGTPTMDDEGWEYNLQQLNALQLPHFSAYSLTVEPRTALANMVRSKLAAAPEEDQAAGQFFRLMEWAKEYGYEHYEISNFALPERYSRHNTAYWNGETYLGIGPSAHSFNGEVRHWNIRNNHQYIRDISQHQLPEEIEILTNESKYNEYILTKLRTQWGIDLELVKVNFGIERYLALMKAVSNSIAPEWIVINEKQLRLTDHGKLFADHIASSLFA